GREILVLLPFFAHLLLLLRRHRLEPLVALPRGGSLGRRELRPCGHLLAKARLLVGRHLGVALRDTAPLGFALGVPLGPFGGERREELLFGRGQLGPRRTAGSDRLREYARGQADG